MMLHFMLMQLLFVKKIVVTFRMLESGIIAELTTLTLWSLNENKKLIVIYLLILLTLYRRKLYY